MTHDFKIVGRAPEEKGKPGHFRDPLRGFDCQFFLDGRELRAVGVKLEFVPGKAPVKLVLEICPSEVNVELDGVLTNLVFQEPEDTIGRAAAYRRAAEEQKTDTPSAEFQKEAFDKVNSAINYFFSPAAEQEREMRRKEFASSLQKQAELDVEERERDARMKEFARLQQEEAEKEAARKEALRVEQERELKRQQFAEEVIPKVTRRDLIKDIRAQMEKLKSSLRELEGDDAEEDDDSYEADLRYE